MHCNTLLHTTTHYNPATHCNTLQSTANTYITWKEEIHRKDSSSRTDTLQHSATHCNNVYLTWREGIHRKDSPSRSFWASCSTDLLCVCICVSVSVCMGMKIYSHSSSTDALVWAVRVFACECARERVYAEMYIHTWNIVPFRGSMHIWTSYLLVWNIYISTYLEEYAYKFVLFVSVYWGNQTYKYPYIYTSTYSQNYQSPGSDWNLHSNMQAAARRVDVLCFVHRTPSPSHASYSHQQRHTPVEADKDGDLHESGQATSKGVDILLFIQLRDHLVCLLRIIRIPRLWCVCLCVCEKYCDSFCVRWIDVFCSFSRICMCTYIFIYKYTYTACKHACMCVHLHIHVSLQGNHVRYHTEGSGRNHSCVFVCWRESERANEK